MSFRRTSLDSLKCAVGPSGNPMISRASETLKPTGCYKQAEDQQLLAPQ